MKKLFFILSFFFFTVAVNAQGTQTEDEVFVGRGKTFGKYNGRGIIVPDTDRKDGQVAMTGIVMRGGVVRGCMDSLGNKQGGFYSFDLKKDDGTIIIIGTRDNLFTVPKAMVGKKIIIEGVDLISNTRRRRTIGNYYQQDIQFAATGLKIL